MDRARISRRKLSDQVVDRIKHWLMAKNIKPGDRLPQEKELIGPSRGQSGTIREALKALEVQGLISVATGRSGGAVVAEVSYETAAGLLGNYFFFQRLQATEIYDLRQLIEPEMAVSAVDRLTETDFKRLEQLIESCANVQDTPKSRRAAALGGTGVPQRARSPVAKPALLLHLPLHQQSARRPGRLQTDVSETAAEDRSRESRCP